MLTSAMDQPSQKLNLIDQIQRLGIAYHFELEIDEQLEQIHKIEFEFHCSDNNNLYYMVALLFRLLRQQGYNISCGIWWKDLDVERKFSFARNRLVELYFWMSAVCFEPEYEVARNILTKVVSILSIIDDIYDVYGTLEELELFMEAIERWDVDANDQLPEYMQACYQIVLDLYDEIGYEVTRQGQYYRLFYAKEAMKKQVRAYFAEAKWFLKNQVPAMEEYMPIALVTSGTDANGDIISGNGTYRNKRCL
ncbi:hypothetical protein NL676_001897 [Syzygium grande]|nr:hypothetical protein NL676_001897 [Syzygium grande]